MPSVSGGALVLATSLIVSNEANALSLREKHRASARQDRRDLEGAAPRFDFARIPQPAGKGDVVVLLSHRGTKSYTVESADAAHKAGAATVGITSVGGPWKDSLDHKIEACEA